MAMLRALIAANQAAADRYWSAPANRERLEKVIAAQAVGGCEVAEEAVLGQVVGESTPDEVDTDAEDRALGDVVGGGVPNEEDEVGEIVLSPVAEEPVADSPTASTISTPVDKP